ncbi:hypothetical protein RhiirC2_852495 [Rhizophagus irregularis]|uniref:Uncharacterized protein n=1 Tax=Rhizophagus irregularis TaxID=588596 RepID=A0A2N1MZD7_9GLOM|nr:hypothetical protein RhiirC2_852495 [Rhizophagus irregularis]
MDLNSNAYFKLYSSDRDETYERIGKALALLGHKHDNETPEMWCSRIRGPFKMILEEYPGIFSNNGYIQTHANPMTLSCYAVNHLKRCINKDTILNEHAYVNGQVTTRFGDGNGFMIINYAPTSNDTFQPVSENFTVFLAEGAEPKYFAIKVDLSKAGAKVGDQGVLQGFYTGATNTLYGCADIKVVDFEVIGGAKSDNKSSGASIISTFEPVDPSHVLLYKNIIKILL